VPAALTKLPKIRINDRLFIAGMTGTGKSILTHYLFRKIPVRLPKEDEDGNMVPGHWRLAIDITDSIYDDAVTFYDSTVIPWDVSPSLRWVPTNFETLEQDCNLLYLQIIAHGNCWVWLDEANEISSAHKTVAGLRKTLLQGRKFQVGHAGVTPRPVDISKSLITQSEHHFIFPLQDSDDRLRIAKNLGMPVDEFEDTITSLPEFGYLWFSVRDRILFQMPPLDKEIVKMLEGET
jgi:hypothetical protein